MAGRLLRGTFLALMLVVITGLGALIVQRLLEADPAEQQQGKDDRPPAAVQVAPIVTGPIVERQRFSGSLVPSAAFTVAPKLGGRIEELALDVGDPVRRGQVVARLESEEFEQMVAGAEAAVAVAQARLGEARSAVGVAQRNHQRLSKLAERGVSSAVELDRADAERLTREAAVAVAEAQVQQAEVELAAARLRLGWCTVTASWTDGDDERVVGERLVDIGERVAINQALLSVLEITPLTAVIHVTERDYRRITPDQGATLRTDAWGDEVFRLCTVSCGYLQLAI